MQMLPFWRKFCLQDLKETRDGLVVTSVTSFMVLNSKHIDAKVAS